MQKLQDCQWGFNVQRKTKSCVWSRKRTAMIQDVHERIGDNSMTKALGVRIPLLSHKTSVSIKTGKNVNVENSTP